MDIINRGVAVIKPKQALHDWLDGLPDPADISLEELRRDCTVILIPDELNGIRATRYIKRIYREIFDAELAAWHLNVDDWPADRDYAMFQAWFEVEIHSLVLDSISALIRRELYVAS